MNRALAGLALSAVAACGLAACGSSGGTAPTGTAVRAPQCPVTRVSSKLTVAACLSPDGAYGILFLAGRGGGKTVEMYHSSNACCSDIAWTRPHLLLFLDYPLVESLDPTTRAVTLLGSLGDAVASPDGRWVAGTGSAGPETSIARTVYVLGVPAKKCLVVPGASFGVAGFTHDGKAVIVERGAPGDKPELRQFAVASLHSDCPRDVVARRVTTTGS